MILKDNTIYSSSKENLEEFLPLLNLSNRKVSELVDEHGHNLLIYPHSFKDCDDRFDKLPIFTTSMDWKDGECTKVHLETGNMIGFIGLHGKSISIHSRFTQDGQEDYFLHYMLQTVLNINIFNLKHETNKDPVFDLLLYLFPKFLKDALSQGIYKEYRHIEYNDTNVRGVIDINRQIRSNIPFNGRIAYHTREFSHDNHVTELIRHTIDYIASTQFGRTLLASSTETRADISQIIAATPAYKKCNREKTIRENLKPVRHPYFTQYGPLQKLCIQILRHHKIKYGSDSNAIYGILFDVSSLWEEYLNHLLKKAGFNHPNNRKRTGTIYLAKHQKFPRYPDFISKDETRIIDAKYKKTAEQRDDIHQMITYMYRLKADTGIFIYPTITKQENQAYPLLGYGEAKAILKTYFFPIPQNPENYAEFVREIQASEKELYTSMTR